MAPPHVKKLKQVTLTVAGQSWQCQTEKVELVNDTDDPEQAFVLCAPPDDSYYEDPDPSYKLDFTALADWRLAGLSRYLWQNDGAVAAFTYVLHPEDPASTVHWTGQVRLKAPTAGGEGRATEKQEISLAVLGKPDFVEGAPV